MVDRIPGESGGRRRTSEEKAGADRESDDGQAGLVFSLIAFDLAGLVAHARTGLARGPRSGRSFGEAQARLIWASAVLLFYWALVAAAVYSLRAIRRFEMGRKKKTPILAGLAAGCLVLGYLAYSSEVRNNFS